MMTQKTQKNTRSCYIFLFKLTVAMQCSAIVIICRCLPVYGTRVL